MATILFHLRFKLLYANKVCYKRCPGRLCSYLRDNRPKTRFLTMKKIILSFLLPAIVFSCFAQNDSLVEHSNTAKSYGRFSVSYLNNSVYNGRKDSVLTPYITPTLGYYDKSGFFINGSLSYLARSGSNRIDLYNIEAGYDFSAGDFDGGLSANKSFYNSSSTNVKAEVTGSVMATAAYNFSFIRPHIEGGVNFGKKPDYFVALGLEHTFYAASDRLQVTPSFVANASTQNYYGSYYKKRKFAGKRKNANGVTVEVQADVQDASKFKFLDYEFNLPIEYNLHKFTFSITPAYAIPVNPAVVTVQVIPSIGPVPAPKIFTEKIENTFYCSFEIGFKF